MFIASVITIRHVRASRNRIAPVQQNTSRRIDRHLMFLMLVQVILSVIFLSMHTVVLAYQYITREEVKDARTRAVELFISQTGILLYYINYAKSFYLHTLTRPFFREIFWKRFKQYCPTTHHFQRRGIDLDLLKILSSFLFFSFL